MKSNLKKIGSLLVLCLLALGARASIQFQDTFGTYPDGDLTNAAVGGAKWSITSGGGTAGPMSVLAGKVNNSQTRGQDCQAFLSVSNAAVDITNILYVSFTINDTILPTGNNGYYFTHFNGSTFKGRIYALTNGAAVGTFRLGIGNGSGTQTNLPTDLSTGTDYRVVARLLLNNAGGSSVSTLWVNPAGESATGVSDTNVSAPGYITTYNFRQPGSTAAGVTTLTVTNLIVGTTFADVVPGSVNPPIVLIQPQDNTTVFAAGSVTFSNLAAGDATISYRWYYNTNTLLTNNSFSVSGAANYVLTMTNVLVGQSGIYSCVSSNAAGTNVTRFATLLVNTVPVPPGITNQPVSITNNTGDTATFTVVAGGSSPLIYQWKVVPFTNSLVTNILTGATGPTLTLSSVTTSLSSNQYFVTITNQFGLTNSTKATLIVKPIPVVTIAALRGMVDGSFAPTNTTSLFTVQGIVTTWADMTGLANTLFYMQDASGGIAVFWSGASGITNLPPAGALVQVTGPMSSFSGLLEIAPVFTNSLHSVTIISTNNPLPKAQPLVFDPNVSGYPATAKTATMNALEGMYFVASNVMLNLTTPNFVSGANDIITNNVQTVGVVTNSVVTVNFTNEAGQTYIMFINAQSGLPGQAKYTGPVTVYGILGYFTAAGFEFTPSRFADIISYVHVTNVLTNARKGDLATNTYTENVVRPGEMITIYVSIGDAAGGIVTLTPTGPLPTGGSWSGITSGATATAVFQYTGNPADVGNNFPIQLAVTSTAGTSYTQGFKVYVPTAQEQQIVITEFLANPTTNPAAAFYNPLARASAVNGISTNDQYVEIVNQSGTDLTSLFTLDKGTASSPVFSSFDGFGATLLSSNSLVVYGGNGSPAVTPGLATPVALSRGLFLPTTTSGVLVLRNSSGYIIDRVAYSAGDLSTNGSLSRFATINSAFVPQAYISTNLATAGLQYDGGSWGSPTKTPTGVSGVVITYVNGKAILNFTANTSQASTLWDASDVAGPYSVIFGKTFPTGTGTFTNVNSAIMQFYFITTQ